MSEQGHQLPTELSASETKTIITPYAFEVNESLFGLPLASPRSRGAAIAIDSIIVGLLAQQDVALLAILAAATFFKAGKGKQDVVKWRRTRRFFRLLGLFLMMLIAYSLIDGVVEKYSEPETEQVDTKGSQTEQSATENVISEQPAQTEPGELEQKAFSEQSDSNPDNDDSEASASQAPATNLTDWVKGIIVNDLGFGFGWAALYFTVFTAWWGGQTPGKRICGIRVIKLDGKPMNLWDTFGRYGGYGAGFATGLLGFFQILWDPNRQAIHDKISATVVIKGDKPLMTAVEQTNTNLKQ